MSIETMTKLATVTVGSGGSSSIDFTNIPQTYTDLILKVSARSTSSSGDCRIELNGSGGTAYSGRLLYGDGSAAASTSNTGAALMSWGAGSINRSTTTSNTFANTDVYIPNYTSANNKSVSTDSVEENNATQAYSQLAASLWANSASITSIKLTPSGSGNFVQYSTATLYGIKNARKTAGNSIKATGGNISFDGTYVVHTFTSSGTFTPTSPLTVDYLVVAGGGGGGGRNTGGGGGAGGYRTSIGTSSLLSCAVNTSYSITVGAGGAGGSSATTGNKGTSGSNSSFLTITSSGGGAGSNGVPPNAGGSALNGVSGGSGGGGGGVDAAPAGSGGSGNAGSYSPVEGYAGGSGNTGANGGGGGGAGAAGSNATGSAGGAGGIGVANSISGTSVYYAGGGGGGGNSTAGTGGTGGGGRGGTGGTTGSPITATSSTVQLPGSPNTGGGGGGSAGWETLVNGGSGGSGIVIIRYKA